MSLYSLTSSNASRYRALPIAKFEETSTEMLTLPPPKRLQIRKFQLDKAMGQLLSKPNNGPVILAQDVSLEMYSKYYSIHEALSLLVCLINGNVIAYEIPLDPRAVVTLHSALNVKEIKARPKSMCYWDFLWISFMSISSGQGYLVHWDSRFITRD
ncbi:hypothetical protein BGZ79_008114 [Entomortierella chlamydospora]|nr:hypothetical protein BGZ79_008114 [Entomortierella chlamydospora]